MKCGPLANNSAALIFAALLFDTSTILLNSGVFLRKVPLVDGFDTRPSKKIIAYTCICSIIIIYYTDCMPTYLYPPLSCSISAAVHHLIQLVSEYGSGAYPGIYKGGF